VRVYYTKQQEEARLKIQTMIDDLYKEGLSGEEIAKKVGATQPTISRLHRGQEPKHELGRKIEKLHSSLIHNKRTSPILGPQRVGKERKAFVVAECERLDLSIRQYICRLLDKEFAK